MKEEQDKKGEFQAIPNEIDQRSEELKDELLP